MLEKLKKVRYNSPVILTYTFICLAVLIIGTITNNASTTMFFTNYRTSFSDPMMYFRMFSHVIGHANWQHFFNNFMLILILGPIVEEKYGSKTLGIMILITALVTGLLNSIFFNTGLLGASGIVFMLILLSSFVNVKSGEIPLTFIIVFIIFVGKEIYTGVLVSDNISQFTHIIGGMCGGVYGYFMNSDRI